jgi:hypothetical protein
MRRVFLAATLLVAFLVMAVPAEGHTLSYRQAKKAAQQKGDAVANKRTRIKSLLRTSPHRYYAQAHWKRVDPNGCEGCGYDPETGDSYDTPVTESCFAEIVVKFRSKDSRRVRAVLTGKSCF